MISDPSLYHELSDSKIRTATVPYRPSFLFIFQNGSLDGPNLGFASIDWYWDRIPLYLNLMRYWFREGYNLGL